MNLHPSFRELDRMALGDGGVDVAAHVGSCASCAEYLAELRDAGPRTATPNRLQHASRRPRASGEWFARRWPRLVLAPTLALAAVWIWVEAAPAPEPAPWVASKGGPSVAIYSLRAGRMALWDGAAPFLPGDRIRIRVSPQDFRHVAVASYDPTAGGWIVIHRGALEGGEVLLPGSWELDATPGPERLLVALDAAPVSTPEKAAWHREIELPKAGAP